MAAAENKTLENVLLSFVFNLWAWHKKTHFYS
jgi:hypothetical protein